MQGMNFSAILQGAAPPAQPVVQPVQQAPVSLTGGIRAPTPVFFLSVENSETGFLSNNSYSPFIGTNGGERYLSAQHYICQKKARVMKDYETEDKILAITLTDEVAKDPQRVKDAMAKIEELGNSVKNFDQALWEQVKIGVVQQALFYKFSQNQPLLIRFMFTQNDILFYADADKEWGIGFDEATGRQVAGAQWNVTIFNVEQIAAFYDQYSRNLLGKILMDVRQKLRQSGIPAWAITLSEEAKAAITRRLERAAQAQVANTQQPVAAPTIQDAGKEEADPDSDRRESRESGEVPDSPRDDTSTHSEEDVPVVPIDMKAILAAPASPLNEGVVITPAAVTPTTEVPQ